MLQPNCLFHYKIYSNRFWDKIGKQCGFLWHYGHFIHDFLMPLNDWFYKKNIDPKSVQIYIQNTTDQSIGNFSPIVEKFFGLKVDILTKEAFDALPYETIVLNAYLFGPFPANTFTNCLKRASEIPHTTLEFDIPPKIILIERGKATLGFENNLELTRENIETGIDRRFIANHSEVVDFLKNRYGKKFSNLILEDMHFEEQVKYFRNAKLVIGQHGAGLNNMIWMKSPRGGIIEICPTHIPTFKNMSMAKSYERFTLGDSSRHPIIDLDALRKLLDRVEKSIDIHN